MKTMMIFGTRPEAIKMCPLAIELKASEHIQNLICLTGQHKDMLQQVMSAFSVEADYNLNIMRKSQTLSGVTSKIIEGLDPIFEKEKPDMILVHGDTSTAFSSALVGFYHKIPVAHVEAGLRTYDKYQPFPEEMNRCLIGQLASYHFAPTENNRKNLMREGITDNIFVTGNTIIDSFRYTISNNYQFAEDVLNELCYENKKIILLTAHRRENWGEPLENIYNAVRRIAEKFSDDVIFVYPVHMNPIVKDVAFRMLGDIPNVILTSPLNVIDMHNLISKCYMVMTDSGGLQEEAPSLGKPVVVLREETERPEAVQAGTVAVTGTDIEKIIDKVCSLIDNDDAYCAMARSVNPYGDGNACRLIRNILESIENKC